MFKYNNTCIVSLTRYSSVYISIYFRYFVMFTFVDEDGNCQNMLAEIAIINLTHIQITESPQGTRGLES